MDLLSFMLSVVFRKNALYFAIPAPSLGNVDDNSANLATVKLAMGESPLHPSEEEGAGPSSYSPVGGRAFAASPIPPVAIHTAFLSTHLPALISM